MQQELEAEKKIDEEIFAKHFEGEKERILNSTEPRTIGELHTDQYNLEKARKAGLITEEEYGKGTSKIFKETQALEESKALEKTDDILDKEFRRSNFEEQREVRANTSEIRSEDKLGRDTRQLEKDYKDGVITKDEYVQEVT